MSPFDRFRKPLEVTRLLPGGYYVDGVWTEGETTTLTIMASVQPVKANELQALPEGRRDMDAYWLFTSEPLHGLGDESPDRVTINGEAYEIVQVNPYQNGVIPHFKSLAAKIQ